MAEQTTYSKAVTLAAPESKAPIEEVAYMLYLAVQENPEQADVMLAGLLEQRKSWKPVEVYNLFVAAMSAHPSPDAPLKEDLAHQAPVEGGAADAGASQVTMVDKLVTVLYNAELPDGVAAAVVENAGVSTSVKGVASSEAADASDADTSDTAAPDAAAPDAGVAESGAPDTVVGDVSLLNQSIVSGTLTSGDSIHEEIHEPIVTPPSEDIVTPGPMSPQNPVPAPGI